MFPDHFAILGGSFNPIHRDHVRIAQLVLNELKLPKLYFMPNGAPPHKSTMVDYADRANMVRAVIEEVGDLRLGLLDIEQSPTTHYTFETLMQIKAQAPHSSIYFVMGMDSLLSLDKWYRGLELWQLAKLVVLQRKGSEFAQLPYTVRCSMAEHRDSYIVLDNEAKDISSTEIRAWLYENDAQVSKVLYDSTLAYIRSYQLYH